MGLSSLSGAPSSRKGVSSAEMLIFRFDTTTMTALWLFFGTTNTDDDFQRYVDSLLKLKSLIGPGTRGTGLMMVERNNPVPNAMWRKRIADASVHIDSSNVYALVSESIAIRGVATAINWLRPPRYQLSVHSNLENAYAWLESVRDRPTVELLRKQFAEIRLEAVALK